MRTWRIGLGSVAVVIFAALLIGFLCAGASAQPGGEGLARALEAQQRHGPKLLDTEGVEGVAAGDDELIVLLLNEGAGRNVPARVDNVRVRKIVTGKITALQTVSRTSRFDRPVPIGISVGNEREVSAGTLGCRVVDGDGNVYALSNNHVFALENTAPIGSKILQPGRYDGGVVATDVIGNLHAFVPIKFDGTANKVDAAIASTTIDMVGTATPSDGYGIPCSTVKSPTVGLGVKKYGRTTGLTSGKITGINTSVKVGYSRGTALFTGQIIVEGNYGMLKSGDSGSLLVTNDSANQPVGLMFAGSSDGKLAVANHIGDVLSAFNVSVDSTPPVVVPVTDIAVTAVAVPSYVVVGNTVNIAVTIKNIGNQYVASDVIVTLNDDTAATVIGSQTVSGLAAGASTTLQFPWNTTGAALGDHTLTASHDFSDDNLANNSKSATVPALAVEPIKVTSISPTSMKAGRTISVTIYGSGFVSGASVAFLNGVGPTPVASSVVVVDSGKITARVYAPYDRKIKKSVWDVRVTNPDASSATLKSAFTVNR